MPLEWITATFNTLPGTEDVLFHKLWAERRFVFDGQQSIGDVVDEYSARIIAAALKKHDCFFVVLPDFQPHRPAFLFATALIRQWLDSRTSSSYLTKPKPVLYFGPTVGIRDHLRRTSVQGLRTNLSAVFSQQDISRGAIGTKDVKVGIDPPGKSSLPQTVTIYAPADPLSFVQIYDPSWIAIDCGDAPFLVWLIPLLDVAIKRGISVIAWGQNSLSKCVNDFSIYGQTFNWSPSIQFSGNYEGWLGDNFNTLLNEGITTTLFPTVIETKSIADFSSLISEASRILGSLQEKSRGQFEEAAVVVHWRYLRSLESLAIPIEFFEAEASGLWGLKSLGQLRLACEHFRGECEKVARHLWVDLEKTGELLHAAQRHLESHCCVLWIALINLCIEEPPNDEVRILVFSGESRKRLFLFALLARYNITEDDLHGIRIYVTSLNELRHWMFCRQLASEMQEGLIMPPVNLDWHPVFVGLPSATLAPKILPIFLHPKVDFLLYPHQYLSFTRRQTEWSERLTLNMSRIVHDLARLANVVEPQINFVQPARLAMAEVVKMNAETTERTKSSSNDFLWKLDAATEIARLFETDDESIGDELVLSDPRESNPTASSVTSEGLWCAEVIKVQFEQGWFAYFVPEDTINVVNSGSHSKKLDLRYIRSLKIGECVLLIHGQQRQSLYDLIISRVHRRPSFEFHVAVIRRWQEELKAKFEQWRVSDKMGSRDLSLLLQQMQERGSRLATTLALSYWLRGLVLCPQDTEDLMRLAGLLDMGFVKQYHDSIVKAANRLRGLHISLSLKLNSWLEGHATGKISKNDDDIIDAELGLTFGDIRNSLLVLRVVEIQNIQGSFLLSNLGRAERAD